MFKIQIIIIMMLLSISILKIRTETNTVLKSQIKKYLYYSKILDDLIASKSDLNSSIKKTLVFTKMKQLEKVFRKYIEKNQKYLINFKKILNQVIHENRMVKQQKNQSKKEKSASDDINSITGFWG
jgi:hypothetical protein